MSRDVILEALLAEAHERDTNPRRIAAYVVTELDRLAGSGEPWVKETLAEFTVNGSMKRCADWRRGQERQTVVVQSGRAVAVPAWASAREADDDGTVTYIQMRFEDFDRDQVVAYIARTEKTRDTLSVDIAAAKAVLAYMDATPTCLTAGEALDALRRVA